MDRHRKVNESFMMQLATALQSKLDELEMNNDRMNPAPIVKSHLRLSHACLPTHIDGPLRLTDIFLEGNDFFLITNVPMLSRNKNTGIGVAICFFQEVSTEQAVRDCERDERSLFVSTPTSNSTGKRKKRSSGFFGSSFAIFGSP